MAVATPDAGDADAPSGLDARLRGDGRDQVVGDPHRRHRAFRDAEAGHDLRRVTEVPEFGRRQRARGRLPGRAQVAVGAGVLAHQRGHGGVVAAHGAGVDDRSPVHQVDVVDRRGHRVDRAIDEALDQRFEGDAAREDEAGRGQRRIGGVEIAEMNLPLVPAAGAQARPRSGVQEGDARPSPRQRQRGTAAHDAGPEHGDVPHRAQSLSRTFTPGLYA